VSVDRCGAMISIVNKMNDDFTFCIVRNDLLTTFRRMFTNEAFAQLDWVVIETTGLADPAPLIQSFYMDKECQQKMRVDGVLTVVDGKHFPTHLTKRDAEVGAHGGVSEALLQVSFADRVLLNKLDLLQNHEVEDLRKAVNAINSSAIIIDCVHGVVDVHSLLNINAFDPTKCAMPLATVSPILVKRDATGQVLKNKVSLRMNVPSQVKIRGVSTFSFVAKQPLNLDKFNEWISRVLQARGANIYRMKGILHMVGYDDVFVCHGVHMIFDGERIKASPTTSVESKLVFIGQGLDREEFEIGFEGTIA
jgi:G3E family GTPase